MYAACQLPASGRHAVSAQSGYTKLSTTVHLWLLRLRPKGTICVIYMPLLLLKLLMDCRFYRYVARTQQEWKT